MHLDNNVIAEIIEGKEATLRRIYPLYAAEFKAWARRYVNCPEADLTDAYQEAMVVFYRNVVTKRLTVLNSSLKTYLFAIGYKQLLRSMRHNMYWEIVSKPTEEELPKDPYFLQLLIEEEDYQIQRAYLGSALLKLAPTCQKILDLYFYQDNSISQIKELLNYQSENSVSVQKSRCLKSLRDILENH
jgi:RNA polymerase sigma factor (sigma-70 family)